MCSTRAPTNATPRHGTESRPRPARGARQSSFEHRDEMHGAIAGHARDGGHPEGSAARSTVGRRWLRRQSRLTLPYQFLSDSNAHAGSGSRRRIHSVGTPTGRGSDFNISGSASFGVTTRSQSFNAWKRRSKCRKQTAQSLVAPISSLQAPLATFSQPARPPRLSLD
jgi:hypothetical protein